MLSVTLANPLRISRWCTPGIGVNLLGKSPLYMTPFHHLMMVTKVLAEGKRLRLAKASQEGDIVRCRLKEAGVQSYEPTDRNSI